VSEVSGAKGCEGIVGGEEAVAGLDGYCLSCVVRLLGTIIGVRGKM